VGRLIEQRSGIGKIPLSQPFLIFLQQQGQIAQLVRQCRPRFHPFGNTAQRGRRQLLLLEFLQLLAQQPGKARQAAAVAEDPELVMTLVRQGTQHHHAALLGQNLPHGTAERLHQPQRESLKGNDLQAGVTRQTRTREQLELELIGCLARRQQHERRPQRIGGQSFPDFRKAAVCLAAAGRSEKKSHTHELGIQGW
jgi:hypothetical protein